MATDRSNTASPVEAMVKRVLRRRRLNRREHLQLTTAILGNPAISASDRNQINRILDYIQAGKVELVN
ncbi:MAG: hypothetical protein O2890_13375 [Cyanobacteria bacterium]|nr:hypothetical protein [Cyanobacteriota bacterium]